MEHTADQSTEIWHGKEEIIRRSLEELSKIKIGYDFCVDYKGPSIIINNDFMRKKYVDIRSSGGRLRLITEISTANLLYCKELVRILELRHLDGIKGNFGIIDGITYGATANTEEGQVPKEYIYSTVRSFVEQQQYLFDMLWDKAIPAEIKMQEIDDGRVPEIIETIRDPNKIQEIGLDLIRTATREILIMFSSARAFYRQAKVGTLDLLGEAVQRRNVKIRILMPMDDLVKEIIQELDGKIDIRYIAPPLQTRVTILVVDRKFSLTVELKDDMKDDSYQAIGLSTYSNSKSTVSSYASIFESLWKQTELYQKLSELYQQLELHNKMQREFINIAAHELRNPIQPILGLSKALSQGVKTKISVKELEFLDIIIRNAKRLQTLTEDILDVTRIESQSLRLSKEKFSLSEMIHNLVVDSRNDQTMKNDIRVVLLSIDDNIFVEADKGRLAQVISNLLNNALKFTKEGMISISAIRKKNDPQQEVIVSIKDTGSGIDPKILPKLFTKYTTKSQTGTGLGLYIAKSILEAHGGKIWAANNVDGKGATFTFSLPIS